MTRRRGKRRAATVATTPTLAVLTDEPTPAAPAPVAVTAPVERRSRGAQVLDEARRFYHDHYHFPSSVQLDVFTLWCAGLTHLRAQDHRYLCSTAVRLYVRASTTNAGKTLLGDFIALTGGRGEVVFSPASTYWGVVRMIAEEHKTVVLDNIDETKGQAWQGQLNIMIAGAYAKSSLLRSGKKNDPEAYVLGPVAITAVGDRLRRREDFRAVVERAIVLDVAKAPPGAKVARFDERDPHTIARVRAIHASCADWGTEIAPDVVTHRPADLPGLIDDGRTLAMWEPLVAIADAAGGEWPDRVRRAIRVLVRGETVETDEDTDPFARLTHAERSMVDASHVLSAALDTAQLDALTAGADVPDSASVTTVELLERMARLPGGDRWAVPEGTDRQRVLKARTMALAADLGMFGVVRSSVKVPAGDGRYVNGWYSSDVLPHRPEGLPRYRPADLEAHTRAVEEDDVPFE